jgi:hypothetical protein
VFDDHQLAARHAASSLRDAVALEVRLLPDGHVALPGTDPDPAATWQILCYTPHEGCVIRAELAGASWVTRIEPASLARRDREVRVTLERQGDPPREPLLGWILFC